MTVYEEYLNVYQRTHTPKRIIQSAVFLFGSFTLPYCALAEDPIEFNRDVRPIISEKCFACHGPDAAARNQDMRFDTQEGLFGKSEFGQPLLVPGDPEESEIYFRITHEDAKEKMPPADFHLKLTDREVDVIKKWIEQGAPWEGHWAFIPPDRPTIPEVSDPTWSRNEIDPYILRRLDRAGLTPAPEASKEILIRRLSLDLTGLPPTPDEVDAFLADESPEAYERVVDRLLASPHFGERMAFPWLDAARYSDTNGYQRDTKRIMWPWRDWVIDAFNNNMPFDQFTIEQLAGDLLPDATLSQKVATGFNRNHRINGEGGIIPEEYAVEYVLDRVGTTSTTWMGLTMACAQCHDHKFDPISQREFYEMYDFFNRVPEEGKGRERGNDMPFIKVPDEADEAAIAQLTSRINELEQSLYSPDERLDELQQTYEATLRAEFATLEWKTVVPQQVAAANGTVLEVQEDQSVLASGEVPDAEQYTITFTADAPVRSVKLDLLMDKRLEQSGPGRSDIGNVILTDFIVHRTPAGSDTAERVAMVEALSDVARMGTEYEIGFAIDSDPATGWSTGSHLERKNRLAIFVIDPAAPIAAGDTLTVTMKHESNLPQHSAGRFKLSTSPSGAITDWTRPTLGTWHYLGPITGAEARNKLLDHVMDAEEGYDAARTYEEGALTWQDKPEWVDGTVVPLDAESKTVTYVHRTIDVAIPASLDLSFGSDDAIKVWIDGEVRLTNNIGRPAEPDQEKLSVFLTKGTHELLIKIVNYSGNSAFYFNARNDGGESLLALMDKVSKPEAARTDAERREMLRIVRMQDPQWLTLNQEKNDAEAKRTEYEANIITTMIMEDMPTPRDTYLLRRGVYDQPDTSEILTASVPALFGEMDESLPRNRLGLAQWLMNPEHPLTARVRVNHYWQMYFGQGIVKTSEDFGLQSTPPSHPELLDQLALDFVDSGWDVKAMQKKIVMSATYRQSSVLTDDHRLKDPENILLGRAPRFRLTAEMIRDQALAVSGLLNPEIGGPSVFPYQPEGMWSSLSFQNMDEFDTNFYRQDTGDKLYRRGLYTYWKRTISPPGMQIFDAADRERCSLREDITNTPVQAMALLNDPTFVEAARKLAERMLREGGESEADRTQYGYRLALAHNPDAERQVILLDGLQAYRQHFVDRAEDAALLLTVGDSTYDETLDESELAAYTMLASVILNLDETITRE